MTILVGYNVWNQAIEIGNHSSGGFSFTIGAPSKVAFR